MRAEKIRELNDTFRTTLDRRQGLVVMTTGVDALASDVKAMVIRRVATFSEFTPENDPHGEHDFGSLPPGSSFGKSMPTTLTCGTGRRTPSTRQSRPACSPSCSRKSIDPWPSHTSSAGPAKAAPSSGSLAATARILLPTGFRGRRPRSCAFKSSRNFRGAPRWLASYRSTTILRHGATRGN